VFTWRYRDDGVCDWLPEVSLRVCLELAENGGAHILRVLIKFR